MADFNAEAIVEELQARFAPHYEQLRKDLLSLQKSMEEITETAYSPDRLVAATVGAQGQLKKLTLDPRIYRTTDANALAATITKTIQDAIDAITAKMMELAEPMLPPGARLDENSGLELDSFLEQLPTANGSKA